MCWDITALVERHVSGVRDVAQPTIGPYMPIEGDAIQHASSTHLHRPQDQRPTAERTVTIAHLFSWTVLTRPKNEVITPTFFLLCLASIDATLTAIVGDRLLPYWYSTIAAGGICVPTLRRAQTFRFTQFVKHFASVFVAFR